MTGSITTPAVAWEAFPASDTSVAMAEFDRFVQTAIDWLGQPQPREAIGSRFGIVAAEGIRLGGQTYHVGVVPHTEAGRPAVFFQQKGLVQLANLPSDAELPFFRAIVAKRAPVYAEWISTRIVNVAVDVEVHPTLLATTTTNYHTLACGGLHRRSKPDAGPCPLYCGPCPFRLERMGSFVIPKGWLYA